MRTTQTENRITINKYLLISVLYLFFNSLFLPEGLLYTAFLTPFFIYWTQQKGQRYFLEIYALLMLPFLLAHLIIGVELKTFIISNILLFTAYVFAVTVHTFFTYYDRLTYIFRQLLIINFIFVLIAVIIFFTPWSDVFWFFKPFTRGVTDFPRLMLLTYEPSHYAMLWVPIGGYYALRLLRDNTELKYKGWITIMVLFPFLLSFSIGVIGALIIAFCFLLLIHPRELLFEKKIFNWITGLILLIISILLLLYLFYPENALFLRLHNVITGNDPSAQGRTSDAFWLAWELVSMKNVWWGAGAGQLKLIGDEFIIQFYNYNPENFPVIRIPNAVAETLVSFGIIGLVGRFALQIYLYFKTKVYDNYYRSLMFFFVFIYQFTGSYLTNLAEYTIWALAFSTCFPLFDKDQSAKA